MDQVSPRRKKDALFSSYDAILVGWACMGGKLSGTTIIANKRRYVKKVTTTGNAVSSFVEALKGQIWYIRV